MSWQTWACLICLAAALFFLLIGCGVQPPRVFPPFSWGQIIAMNHNALARACGPTAGVWDNGTARPRWAPVAGCAIKGKDSCLVLVEDSCQGAAAIPHEIAHCQGVSDPDNEGYKWRPCK